MSYTVGYPVNGSSPRTWGNVPGDGRRGHRRRFIPTHVGKCTTSPSTTSRRTVHPHARGEMVHVEGMTSPAYGSSPRTWGNVGLALGYDRIVRFIPTHVGKCENANISASGITVHPHARGEMSGFSAPRAGLVGSSPRTWGNVGSTAVFLIPGRFIPTHVGKCFSQIDFLLVRRFIPTHVGK